MSLSEDEATRLRAHLVEAEDALHRLEIGRQKVQVRTETGEAVHYAPSDETKLLAYIATLKRKLGVGGARGPVTLAIG